MSAPAALLDPPRRRALALIGVDVYVLRTRAAAAAPMEREAAPVVREAVREAAPPQRDGGTAEAPRPAEARVAAIAPRVVFVADGAPDFAGPAGPLLHHLALALGLDPSAVAFGAPREGLPCVCFGAAPGASADVVLAPPLPTLRASAKARRALWPALRALARRLRG